jgi:hypothetical protein
MPRDILAECPRFNLMDCRCACSTLVGEGATFYPRSGCLRLGRSLYSVRDIAHFGVHFWHDLVHHKARADHTLFVHRGPHALQPTLRLCYNLALPIERVPAIHVWRIQRALRQAAARRMRAVALLMALHPRLGAESHPLNVLPEALARLVLMSVE